MILVEKFAAFVAQTPTDQLAAYIFRAMRAHYGEPRPPSTLADEPAVVAGPHAQIPLHVHPSGSLVDALVNVHHHLSPEHQSKIEDAIPKCLTWWMPGRDGLAVISPILRLSLQLPAVPMQDPAFHLLTSNRLSMLPPNEQDEIVALLVEHFAESPNSRFMEFVEIVRQKEVHAPSLFIHTLYREIALTPSGWAYSLNASQTRLLGYINSDEASWDIFIAELYDKVGLELFAREFRHLSPQLLEPILSFLDSVLSPVVREEIDGKIQFADRATLARWYPIEPAIDDVIPSSLATDVSDDEIRQRIESVEAFDATQSRTFAFWLYRPGTKQSSRSIGRNVTNVLKRFAESVN